MNSQNQNFLVNKNYWRTQFQNHFRDYINQDYYDNEDYQKGFNDAYKAALHYAEKMILKQRKMKTQKSYK